MKAKPFIKGGAAKVSSSNNWRHCCQQTLIDGRMLLTLNHLWEEEQCSFTRSRNSRYSHNSHFFSYV